MRSQLALLTSSERSVRAELSQVQQDNDSLQAKYVLNETINTIFYTNVFEFHCRLHGLVSARQTDKQTLASLEKRLQEERKCRTLFETQLSNERRARASEVLEASKAQQRLAALESQIFSSFLSLLSLVFFLTIPKA